jgi:hypothetical protein
MAGEIIEGKRTFIQRQGRRAFELPDQHTAKFEDFGGSYGQVIGLNAPLGGAGHYSVDRLEELDDRVIVHVGAAMMMSGPGHVGEGPRPPVAGYPFLDD